MNLYRQHSDDLNAYLYHQTKGRKKGRPRAAAGVPSVRHECCERPILTPQPLRWCPAPPAPAPPAPVLPARHGCHSAPHNHRDFTSTLPRSSLAVRVDLPDGSRGSQQTRVR